MVSSYTQLAHFEPKKALFMHCMYYRMYTQFYMSKIFVRLFRKNKLPSHNQQYLK